MSKGHRYSHSILQAVCLQLSRSLNSPRVPAPFPAATTSSTACSEAPAPGFHAQVSTDSPRTFEKCRTLFVTRMHCRTIACAAMRTSKSPIGLPCSASMLPIRPNSAAAASSNDTTSTDAANVSIRLWSFRDPFRSAPYRSSARVIALMRRSDGRHARMRAPTPPCPRRAKLTLSVSRRYFTMARRDSVWIRLVSQAAWECPRAMRPNKRETPQATRQPVQG